MSELADKYKEFFYMLKEFWTTASDSNVFIGIIVGFALLVILLRRINEIESRNKKKKMETAIALGHVVMAERGNPDVLYRQSSKSVLRLTIFEKNLTPSTLLCYPNKKI